MQTTTSATTNTWYRDVKFAYGSYLVAFIGLVAFYGDESRHWLPATVATLLLGIAVCALVVGFLVRFFPVFAIIWHFPIARWLLVVYGAIATVAASAPAKHIVSSALRLPATDFTSTLALWTLFCAPEFWLFGAALLSVCFYSVILCRVVIEGLVVNSLICAPLRAGMRLVPRLKSWLECHQDGTWQFALRAFIDVAAAAALSIALGYGVNVAYNFVDRPALVRLVAFHADYGNAPDYPGVDHDAPFVLHANNIVSYAHLVGHDVVIRMGRVSSASGS